MKATKTQNKKTARRYPKLVEWSEEDRCFVGSAPPLIGHSCHGKTEAAVVAQLQTILEEWVEMLMNDGKPLPESLTDRKYSGNFQLRISPDLHKHLALKAAARGESLNRYIAEELTVG